MLPKFLHPFLQIFEGPGYYHTPLWKGVSKFGNTNYFNSFYLKHFSERFYEVKLLQNQSNKDFYRDTFSRWLDMESGSGLCPK